MSSPLAIIIFIVAGNLLNFSLTTASPSRAEEVLLVVLPLFGIGYWLERRARRRAAEELLQVQQDARKADARFKRASQT